MITPGYTVSINIEGEFGLVAVAIGTACTIKILDADAVTTCASPISLATGYGKMIRRDELGTGDYTDVVLMTITSLPINTIKKIGGCVSVRL